MFFSLICVKTELLPYSFYAFTNSFYLYGKSNIIDAQIAPI